jgi:hypothetical protein
MDRMTECDEELTIVLLAVLHLGATIQNIVNLAAQAAALQGPESTCSVAKCRLVRWSPPDDPFWVILL